MPERKQPKPARASGGSRGRARFAARDQGGRFSRPLLAALIVILAGGAYLFWPRGGSPPSGIGEQLTVVTADSSIVPAPRSGSVEIDDQQMPLVPEKPATDAAGASGQPAPEPEVVAPVEQKPATTSPPPSRPAPARSQAAAPAKPAIKPHPSGSLGRPDRGLPDGGQRPGAGGSAREQGHRRPRAGSEHRHGRHHLPGLDRMVQEPPGSPGLRGAGTPAHR